MQVAAGQLVPQPGTALAPMVPWLCSLALILMLEGSQSLSWL